MKKSSLFLNAKRGTKGRRSTRRLDDEAVARAVIRNENPHHRMTFASRAQRAAIT